MRSRVVLFGGGTAPDVFNDTWEFDGTDWMQLVTGSSPPARTVHDIVCDTRRNRIVLFGGRGGSSDELLSDTWELMRPLSEHVYLPSVVRNGATE
jgi:hypothetical protein